MSIYLIVKVLESQSVYLPSTLIYRDVELRSSKADLPEETELFKLSAKSSNLDYSKYSHCARIATIVDESNLEKAICVAESRFSEILDLKSIELPISNFTLSNIGIVKDLKTGSLQQLENKNHQPSMSFVVRQGDVQSSDITHYILSENTELSKRYLRSLHWFRNSKHENNMQLKILFNWFAVEALLKESEKDNIGGTIRWFLGFPNGKEIKNVSPHIIKALESHERYGYWKKEIVDIIDKIRVFRNESVHQGFRSVDFTTQELELYNQIMIFGASRCQGAVQQALINRISTVAEFKEYIALIFEQNTYLLTDVPGNIIFSLDQLNCT
ncbi:hypothetical protein GNP73_17400 [Aliivibrio fischeri]|uniref:HEPN domain-containing protein n=1 Tax=Aliivibrio fischeri TaxID=668 RepID=UPI0012DA098D|nr:HEPN domain-containing protein [Aliivibrio fischeri]MUJ29744.1 hypothetical protein [Aliivibrio fischeri]